MLKGKKIIILISILVLGIATPLIGYQAYRTIKKNSLDFGFYIIESVNCTAKFGDSIALMVKPSLNTRYELFPEVIYPMENSTYYDSATRYSCFVERGSYDDPVYTYTFKLDIKVKQNSISQKLIYTAVVIDGAEKWSESFTFDKLGVELHLTFRLFSVSR